MQAALPVERALNVERVKLEIRMGSVQIFKDVEVGMRPGGNPPGCLQTNYSLVAVKLPPAVHTCRVESSVQVFADISE